MQAVFRSFLLLASAFIPCLGLYRDLTLYIGWSTEMSHHEIAILFHVIE